MVLVGNLIMAGIIYRDGYGISNKYLVDENKSFL